MRPTEERKSTLLELVYDEIEFETESGWLLSFEENNVWLPKSQCEIDIGEGRVEVPAWLAIEKGLEGMGHERPVHAGVV